MSRGFPDRILPAIITGLWRFYPPVSPCQYRLLFRGAPPPCPRAAILRKTTSGSPPVQACPDRQPSGKRTCPALLKSVSGAADDNQVRGRNRRCTAEPGAGPYGRVLPEPQALPGSRPYVCAGMRPPAERGKGLCAPDTTIVSLSRPSWNENGLHATLFSTAYSSPFLPSFSPATGRCPKKTAPRRVRPSIS
jgi:hypothetical protein